MAGATQTDNGANTAEQEMFVLDMGKKKRKQVRRLRRGRGKLMRRVAETVSDLKSEGEINEDAQVVVVVVRQKRRRNRMFGW